MGCILDKYWTITDRGSTQLLVLSYLPLRLLSFLKFDSLTPLVEVGRKILTGFATLSVRSTGA
jgi:hypothetical protein